MVCAAQPKQAPPKSRSRAAADVHWRGREFCSTSRPALQAGSWIASPTRALAAPAQPAMHCLSWRVEGRRHKELGKWCSEQHRRGEEASGRAVGACQRKLCGGRRGQAAGRRRYTGRRWQQLEAGPLDAAGRRRGAGAGSRASIVRPSTGAPAALARGGSVRPCGRRAGRPSACPQANRPRCAGTAMWWEDTARAAAAQSGTRCGAQAPHTEFPQTWTAPKKTEIPRRSRTKNSPSSTLHRARRRFVLNFGRCSPQCCTYPGHTKMGLHSATQIGMPCVGSLVKFD
mmetsp:Transcript_21104/g.36223  ORF Transcript_21104/g.36223 Transcript_21104/m.36223 type:complete len:286 (-) Transcript_21104:45-902(-)